MSHFQNFKYNSYFVVGIYFWGTNYVRQTLSSRVSKMLTGDVTKCRTNKSMFISGATKNPKGLKESIKNVGKATVNIGKNSF